MKSTAKTTSFFVIYMKTPCSANLRLCKPFRIIILNQ